ncbi:MAG TPA: hypothetical protein VMW38_05265 [Terriglobia bacterium]|nr:hypothetical protein [Terriglobia bacterium]
MSILPGTPEFLCHSLKRMGDLFAPHDTLDRLLEEAARVSLELLGVDHAFIVWATDSPQKVWVRAKWSQLGVDGIPILSDQVVAIVERIQRANSDGLQSRSESWEANENGMMIRCLKVKEESVGYLVVLPGLGRQNHFPSLLFSIIGDQIGRTIEVYQIRQFLASRYSSLALCKEAEEEKGEIQPFDSHLLTAVLHPEKVARLLAKSFYRDLRRAGFDTNQVLFVASEIIANLTATIRKTRAKADRESNPS